MVQSRRNLLQIVILLAILTVGITVSVVYFSQSTHILDSPQIPDPPLIQNPPELPQAPVDVELSLIGEIDTGGYALSVHVKDDFAFVIDYGSGTSHGLVIVNCSNPLQPEILSTYHTGGFPYAVESVGDIVYLADEMEGLVIIDISDPNHPLEIEGFSGSGMAFDLEIVGDFLFLADYEWGMVVLDISIPSNPEYVASYGPDCFHLEIEDDIAYVAGYGRIRVLNVSDPYHPTLLGQTSESGITLWDPSVSNGTVYLANHSGDDGELLIYDARNPSNINKIGEFDSTGTFQSFFVDHSMLYAVDFVSGLYVLDVTNATFPVEIERFSDGQPWDVTICDGLVYLVGSEGLQILEATYIY